MYWMEKKLHFGRVKKFSPIFLPRKQKKLVKYKE